MELDKPAHGNQARTWYYLPLIVATTGIISASLIGSASMGARQTFGLLIEPLSLTQGFSLAMVAFAIAIHNLVWGLAQPFAGAAADRFGPGPVVAVGAFLLSGGLLIAANASSPLHLFLGLGLLFGMGVSCTSFGVVLTAVGRAAPPEKRNSAMGLASAGGSFGLILMVPYVQSLTGESGAALALTMLAVITLIIAPLGYLLERAPPRVPARQGEYSPSTKAAVLVALSHRGYCLLCLGFFTCGFQLAFIATHLPTYLTLCNARPGVGAVALATIGFFNMIGSWVCGMLGNRFRQARVLALIYAVRAVAIGTFFFAPKSEINVIAFAGAMGFLWLGTVPLTTGTIATFFGTRHLGTLFGFSFLSHQLGSFIGSWAGGVIFETTGSYDTIWIATSAAGVIASALHVAIPDEPASAHPDAAPA